MDGLDNYKPAWTNGINFILQKKFFWYLSSATDDLELFQTLLFVWSSVSCISLDYVLKLLSTCTEALISLTQFITGLAKLGNCFPVIMLTSFQCYSLLLGSLHR